MKKVKDDKRNVHRFKRFAMINEDNMDAIRSMIHKNPVAADIFMFLTKNMDNYNAVTCSPKHLEEITKKSKATVWRAVKFLKEEGYVNVLKMGSSPVFVMNDNVVWRSWNSNKEYCRFEGPMYLSKSENIEVEKKIQSMQKELRKVL
jgi:hypothetical protein